MEGETRLPFLFEYDTGSERLARLEAKLPGYATLARAAKHPTWVLFSFPSGGRETAARSVLVHSQVPVATAVVAPGHTPDNAVWLAVGTTGPRRRLAGLGHPSEALERKEVRQMLQKAITSLPEKYREVFLLRDVEELNNVETAAALSITVGNVKVRLHRARLMLQKQLTPLLRNMNPKRRWITWF